VLPLKDLCGRSVGEKVTGWDGKILEELEGLLAGGHGSQGTLLSDRAGFALAKGTAGKRKDRADYSKNYSILVQLVKDYL